jgi:type VI secretion system protein VasD
MGDVGVTVDQAGEKVPLVAYTARLPILAIAVVLLMAGCSKPSPPPPPTVVKLQTSAALDTNLTPDGQGAPVLTRIYQLGSKSAFDSAEFFPLYKTDAATLGPDLVKKEEFLLIPGGSKAIELMPADAVHAIGVFGAFADFQNVKWRASADIPAHQTTTIIVTMERTGVKLVAKSVKPAAP